MKEEWIVELTESDSEIWSYDIDCDSREEAIDRFKLEIGYGVCDECKRCSNYFVSEIGCWGNEKPCEYLCEH